AGVTRVARGDAGADVDERVRQAQELGELRPNGRVGLGRDVHHAVVALHGDHGAAVEERVGGGQQRVGRRLRIGGEAVAGEQDLSQVPLDQGGLAAGDVVDEGALAV